MTAKTICGNKFYFVRRLTVRHTPCAPPAELTGLMDNDNLDKLNFRFKTTVKIDIVKTFCLCCWRRTRGYALQDPYWWANTFGRKENELRNNAIVNGIKNGVFIPQRNVEPQKFFG